MTPCCNEKLFPFFRAGALQPDDFQSSRKIQQATHRFHPRTLRAASRSRATLRGSPVGGGWVTKPSPGSVQAGVCAALFFPLVFFFFPLSNGALFSGGDGGGWRGARGSPLLARKPDAWSHCLALPGKAGKASAGVIKQHAGAAGSAQPASEGPLGAVAAPPKPPRTANVTAVKTKKKSPRVGLHPPPPDRRVARWVCARWL